MEAKYINKRCLNMLLFAWKMNVTILDLEMF